MFDGAWWTGGILSIAREQCVTLEFTFLLVIISNFMTEVGGLFVHSGSLVTSQHDLNLYLESRFRSTHINESPFTLILPNLFIDIKAGSTILRESHLLKDSIVCSLCDTLISFLYQQKKSGTSSVQIKAELIAMCQQLKIEDERVCREAIELHADIILYIFDNYENIVPGKFCDLTLQQYSCNLTNIEWIVDIPDGQSVERNSDSTYESTYKILHVTDVHMDLLYTPNKTKYCSEPICCQSDQDDGTEGNSCGYWAEYGNDVSENLIDEFIRFANNFDIDFVYFTGDIISHRIWSTTQESNAEIIEKFLTKLKNGFSVPVYATLGNHEPSPLNQFAYDESVAKEYSTKWLFSLVEQEWSGWLPESAVDTISKGGFYTVSPIEGLRIIVLNNNVAYAGCWWLMQDDIDPYSQLDWLVSILSKAELNGESVHILGHIPTGSRSIMRVWSREYNKIVSRFANTITGQFNGHVHVDTFQVYYNISNEDQAVNVAWNGASLVPYDNANPSFKIYEVDAKTFRMIDIDQWTFDLDKANSKPESYPDWYKIYTFKDAFKLSSLQPRELNNLLEDMARNHTKLGEYHLYRYKNSPFATSMGCDETCQKDYLCELATSVVGNTQKCDYLRELYDANL